MIQAVTACNRSPLRPGTRWNHPLQRLGNRNWRIPPSWPGALEDVGLNASRFRLSSEPTDGCDCDSASNCQLWDSKLPWSVGHNQYWKWFASTGDSTNLTDDWCYFYPEKWQPFAQKWCAPTNRIAHQLGDRCFLPARQLPPCGTFNRLAVPGAAEMVLGRRFHPGSWLVTGLPGVFPICFSTNMRNHWLIWHYRADILGMDQTTTISRANTVDQYHWHMQVH